MSRAKRVERRIISVWWPNLAIDRWAKRSGAAPDEKAVLVLEAQHGQIVHAATETAIEAGARPGMRLTDARALDPTLPAIPADPQGDAALVQRLARWASRWSPLVEIEGSDGLRIDATGIAHLFGGEEALLADIGRRCGALGLATRAAAAATPRAAWALARYARAETTCCPRSRTAAMLAPLPVAALALAPDVTRVLERLGLKTIGTLAGIERRSLARRFREADNPLDALDRALGKRADPFVPVEDLPPPRALLRLSEPVADPAAAAQALDLLVPDLVRQLRERNIGARRLVLAGYRSDGEVEVEVAAASLATRDPGHLRRLLADKTERLDPGFGFDGFALEADWTEPLDSAQDALSGGVPVEVEVARLVDRLGSKLGHERVRRPAMHESHLPERANGWQAAANGRPQSVTRSGSQRPQRLLDRPEAISVIYATPAGLPRRFSWRRAVHDVVRAEGPERIAPEWWRERSTARLRDYYRVEDRQGRRFWIFREGLHGDGRGGDPAWYIHGMFG